MDSELVADNVKAVITEIKRKRPVDAKGEFILTISVASTMGPGVWVAIRDQE
jgi:large subunit ribosomal protein L1